MLHEAQMPIGHVEVTLLPRQGAGLRNDDGAHEHRVAELIVIGHGLEHLPRGIESEIGHLPDHGDIARVSRFAGKFREHDVACHDQSAGTGKAILSAVEIGLDEPADILELAKPGACDQRNRADIPGLIKIPAVLGRKLLGQLPRRARATPFELNVRRGLFDAAAQRSQVSKLSGPVARGYTAICATSRVFRLSIRPESPSPATSTRSGAWAPSHRHNTCDSGWSRYATPTGGNVSAAPSGLASGTASRLTRRLPRRS